MTAPTAITPNVSTPGRLLGRLRFWQRRLSDRAHAAGDQAARRHGWQVTVVTGRAGFDGRIYRDPRFDQRAAARPTPARAPATRAHP